MTRDSFANIPDGSLVTLDTAPIIYYLQDHEQLAPYFAPVFDAVSQGRLQIIVSSITLAEVMGGPLRDGNEILAAQYREVLTRSAGWQTLPVDEDVAVEAARLRARYRLRLPDAIQVATAILSHSYALVTHDSELSKITDIRVLGIG